MTSLSVRIIIGIFISPTIVFVIAFSALMVLGRLVSGVHWATDIIGSVLLAAGLFLVYRAAVEFSDCRRAESNTEG